MSDFKVLLESLTNAGVNFIIVGAFAAAAHGAEQVTQDLDICYERTPENLKRLVAALIPYHPRLRGAPDDLPFLFDHRTLSQGMNFTLQTDLGDVDLLGHLSGVEHFQELARDAISLSLYGFQVRVASLDAVIRSKRAAARPKDIVALQELEALREIQHAKEKKDKD